MRKKLLFGVVASFGLTSSVFGQGPIKPCGTDEHIRRLYAENPELLAEHQLLLKNSAHTEITKSGDSTTVYIIPIVFHIIHQYGSENISDAQVYDQMRILNEDFRKLNADTTDIIPEFQAFAGDAKIEFRLATRDPLGNCTNGIEHIYSHLTNNGDDFSKLNQWNRSKYLNIWVTRQIGEAGVAGYAFYPSGAEGSSFFRDGVIILHPYIGSIGTGTPGNSRALTHEIGHWLNLSHTWGDNNDNNVGCGDDGLDDTPETQGSPTGNCNLGLNECNPGIIENVQNYMDYSYCSRMFSLDQIDRMRTAIISPTSNRDNLWTAENLDSTGADYAIGSMPSCAPKADFFPNKSNTCVGDNVTFNNYTHGMVDGDVATYSWTFQDGTPATSTATSPSVSFNTPGWKTVTLTATNANGSDTKTETSLIYVHGEWAEFTGPAVQNFDSGSDFWISQNPEENYNKFQKTFGNGRNGTNCYVLINNRDISNAIPFSDEAFYYDRLGETVDNLITPSFDLRSTTGVQISFDFSYGAGTLTTADITEQLIVYSSRDCGNTWTQRKVINFGSNPSIVTAGYVGFANFIPSNDDQWKTVSFNYTPNSTDAQTRFKFEFTASDFSNNLFIDNFNVSGTLGLEENITSLIEVSPNPVQTGSSVNVTIPSTEENLTIELVDINGSLISRVNVSATSGAQTVAIPMNVAQGIYFLNAIKGNEKTTRRVVVQ